MIIKNFLPYSVFLSDRRPRKMKTLLDLLLLLLLCYVINIIIIIIVVIIIFIVIVIIIIIINPAVFSFSSADDLEEKRYTEEKMQKFNMKITTKSDIRYTYRKI